MAIKKKKLISMFVIFCLMFSSTVSFAENETGEIILPEVKIVSPSDGANISAGYEMGINNPYGSSGAPVFISVEFTDSGYTFEKIEIYSNDTLIIKSEEKKEKYCWMASYPSWPSKKSFKAVCYYAGDVKIESPVVNATVNIAHVDKHYYKIYGSIALDMPTQEQNTIFLKDIKASHCTLNQDGKFSYLDTYNYDITITKKNHLKIILKVPSGKLNCSFNSIKMIPGDIEINGEQDGVINMLDVLQIAKHFDTVQGDEDFDESLDFNLDGAINITEIIMMSLNFGAEVPTITGM